MISNEYPPRLNRAFELGLELEEQGRALMWSDLFDLGFYLEPAELILELLDCTLFDRSEADKVLVSELQATVYYNLLHASFLELVIGQREDETASKNQWQLLQNYLIDAMQNAKAVVEILQNILYTLSEIGLFADDAFMQIAKEFMMQKAEHDDAKIQSGEDFAAMETALLQGLNEIESELEIYQMFVDQFTYMPDDTLAGLLDKLWYLGETKVKDALILFLLHPQQTVRVQLLHLLSVPQHNKEISPKSLERLIRQRNWLEKELQPQLDAVIRMARKTVQPGIDKGGNKSAAELTNIWVSSVDGVGAQSVLCRFKVGRKVQLAGCVFRENSGYVDSWMTGLISVAEAKNIQQRMLEEIYSLEVGVDYLQMQFKYGLWLNQQTGQPLSPEILLLLEMLDTSNTWQPHPLDQDNFEKQLLTFFAEENSSEDQQGAEVWQTADEIEKSLKRSAGWVIGTQSGWVTGWFEMDEQLDQRLDDYIGDMDLVLSTSSVSTDSVSSIIMEPYRQKWRLRFLMLALWALSNCKKRGPKAGDFLLLAQQLASGTAMDQIPLMEKIAQASLDAYHQRMEELEAEELFDEGINDTDEEPPVEITEQQEQQLIEFLQGDQVPEDTLNYIQLRGYLFTIVRAPEQVTPGLWLPGIFGGLQLGEIAVEKLQEITETIMLLYNYEVDLMLQELFEVPCEWDLTQQGYDFLPLPAWYQGIISGIEFTGGIEAWHGAITVPEIAEDFLHCLESVGQTAEATKDSVIEELEKNVEADAEFLTFIGMFYVQQTLIAEEGEVELQSEERAADRPDLTMPFKQEDLNHSMLQQIEVGQSKTPHLRDVAKIGRNEPCPCGSGKKYKKCCLILH